jgi:hypothetical protein
LQFLDRFGLDRFLGSRFRLGFFGRFGRDRFFRSRCRGRFRGFNWRSSRGYIHPGFSFGDRRAGFIL